MAGVIGRPSGPEGPAPPDAEPAPARRSRRQPSRIEFGRDRIERNSMKSLGIVVVVALLVAGSILLSRPAVAREQDQKSITLTNVSYDPTRELYKDISEKFS